MSQLHVHDGDDAACHGCAPLTRHVAVSFYADEKSRRRSLAVGEAGWRAGRLAWTVGLIAMDYKYLQYTSNSSSQQLKVGVAS